MGAPHAMDARDRHQRAAGRQGHGASETGTASGQVLASAKALAGESEVLRSEVENFLVSVRAA